MNEQTNTTDNAQVDMVAQDFKTAVVIVSLVTNLAVFTTWMALAIV